MEWIYQGRGYFLGLVHQVLGVQVPPSPIVCHLPSLSLQRPPLHLSIARSRLLIALPKSSTLFFEMFSLPFLFCIDMYAYLPHIFCNHAENLNRWNISLPCHIAFYFSSNCTPFSAVVYCTLSVCASPFTSRWIPLLGPRPSPLPGGFGPGPALVRFRTPLLFTKGTTLRRCTFTH